MLKSLTRHQKIALAAVTILVIVVAAYLWYRKRHRLDLQISGYSLAQDNSLYITVSAAGPSNPMTWVGKTATMTTKSLGVITSPITDVNVTRNKGDPMAAISFPTGTYTGQAVSGTVGGDDHIVISL